MIYLINRQELHFEKEMVLKWVCPSSEDLWDYKPLMLCFLPRKQHALVQEAAHRRARAGNTTTRLVLDTRRNCSMSQTERLRMERGHERLWSSNGVKELWWDSGRADESVTHSLLGSRRLTEATNVVVTLQSCGPQLSNHTKSTNYTQQPYFDA